jgi:UDP-2,3-diacylglucosamine pyrophosphatase LpxH
MRAEDVWVTRDLIVISDLHLAADTERGLFRSDTELTSFFRWVLKEAKGCRLILNGDIFDFLAPGSKGAPKRAFNVEEAPVQVADIISKHRQVFQALGEIARSVDHQLVIASGNHDPELALPEVQEQIEKELLGARSSRQIVWAVHGIAMRARVGAAQILIEHGDQYDPWNRIDHDSVRATTSMSSKGITWDSVFVTPPGSELVINHLNNLRENHPWIDLLKPEVEAVLPVILEMTSLKEKMAHSEIVRLRLKALAQSAVMASWRKRNPEKLFRVSRQDLFQDYLDSINPERQMRSKSPRDKYRKIIWRLKKVSKECTFFNISASDEPPEVKILLTQGVDAVIHGHTHSAKAHQVGRGLYLNAGTWGQLLRLPSSPEDGKWRSFLQTLEQSSFKSETRPTFLRVQQASDDAEVALASLCVWGEPPVLWSQWRFDSRKVIWSEIYRAPETPGCSVTIE